MDKAKQQRHKKRNIPEHKKNEIREAFVLFDSDKDEQIDYHELKVALRALGFEKKKADVQKLMRMYDHDSEHNPQAARITYDQFVEMVSDLLLLQDPRDEVLRAFKLLDDDQTGKISLRNLRRVARELGEQLTDEELRAMIDEFDKDGDGEINLEEFTVIMTGDADDEYHK